MNVVSLFVTLKFIFYWILYARTSPADIVAILRGRKKGGNQKQMNLRVNRDEPVWSQLIKLHNRFAGDDDDIDFYANADGFAILFIELEVIYMKSWLVFSFTFTKKCQKNLQTFLIVKTFLSLIDKV